MKVALNNEFEIVLVGNNFLIINKMNKSSFTLAIYD